MASSTDMSSYSCPLWIKIRTIEILSLTGPWEQEVYNGIGICRFISISSALGSSLPGVVSGGMSESCWHKQALREYSGWLWKGRDGAVRADAGSHHAHLPILHPLPCYILLL